MNNISVAIITKNEEKNIRNCLDSVAWVDEIVIVDSGSEDATVQICIDLGCKVHETKWLGFGKTKQKAVDLCSNDWVFVIDADEVLSQELKAKIKEILLKPEYYGYRVKRNSFYLGQQIKFCGWNNDFTLRLFNKKYGQFNEKEVHESIQIQDNRIGIIREPMLHYTYPDLEKHIHKMSKYGKLSAKYNKKGKSSSIIMALLHGIFKFFKMYFFQLGFLDGKKGFVLCLNSGFGVYLKYLYLWEKNGE